jgi:hypothetical protein
MELRGVMMKNSFYEEDRQKRKEAYLLAKGNPWLLWRLQAFRAGYVPPLLPGRIPPELLGIPLGPPEDYTAEELVKHANEIRVRERHYLSKMFTVLIISMSLFIGLSIFLQIKTGSRFRIPVLESLIPRVEVNQGNIR